MAKEKDPKERDWDREMREVDKLLASDTTRTMLVDKLMANSGAAQGLMTAMAKNSSMLDGVIGLAVQDSSMKAHVMTLFKGMQMAAMKK